MIKLWKFIVKSSSVIFEVLCIAEYCYLHPLTLRNFLISTEQKILLLFLPSLIRISYLCFIHNNLCTYSQ